MFKKSVLFWRMLDQSRTTFSMIQSLADTNYIGREGEDKVISHVFIVIFFKRNLRPTRSQDLWCFGPWRAWLKFKNQSHRFNYGLSVSSLSLQTQCSSSLKFQFPIFLPRINFGFLQQLRFLTIPGLLGRPLNLIFKSICFALSVSDKSFGSRESWAEHSAAYYPSDARQVTSLLCNPFNTQLSGQQRTNLLQLGIRRHMSTRPQWMCCYGVTPKPVFTEYPS